MSERSAIARLNRAAVEGKWLNAANLMTALRVALAPVVVALVLAEKPYAAGIVFVLAALTDKADGYYARKNDSVTELGKFLDPLADKLLMIPVMATLWYMDLFPLWALLIVLGREGLISIIRVVGARRKISFPASWSGKVKMFLQIVVVGFLIFFPGSAETVFARVLVIASSAITAYSGVDYVFRARREIFGRAGIKPVPEEKDPGIDPDDAPAPGRERAGEL